MNSRGTASGKLLLCGEHAVVYGYRGLATSISLSAEVRLDSKIMTNPVEDKVGVISAALEMYGLEEVGVEVISEIPVGSGLGSSAGVSIATLRAAAAYKGIIMSEEELFEQAMVCERMAHGTPSGIDPAAVIYGLITYRKAEGPRLLKQKPRLTLGLLQSGRPFESTGEMVELVHNFKLKRPRYYRQLFEKTEELSLAWVEQLSHQSALVDLMRENQSALSDMGVVGATAQAIVSSLEREGIGVKVTGAGGLEGGSGVLMCYHPDLEKLTTDMIATGLPYWIVNIGE